LKTYKIDCGLGEIRNTRGEFNVKTVTLDIPNISCNHCIMTVKREAGFVDGAEFVSGDIGAKKAVFEVEDDKALQALKETLAEAGYPPIG
jgi:Cu+-exporting ATPase